MQPSTRPSDPSTAAIDTPAGRIVGLDRGETNVFKAIPFARADRFDPPVDVESWSGTLEAVTFGPQAPQNSGALEGLIGATTLPQSEDCLTLNVYAPARAEGCPVMVWIHGGAFLTGGGATPWYDGSRLAIRGGVVVVTINYRLGALGFLGHRNLGTLDQVAALRWVRRNIAAFGGDPANVTVFGESAGGSAAISLMATPGGDELFHRAWAMSPSITQLRTATQAERYEQQFLELAGSDSVEGLRDRPLVDILAAQAALVAQGGAAGLRVFSPTDGTDTIPGPFGEVVAADGRPLVIGTTRDESNLFTAYDPTRSDWDDADVEREFATRFGERAPHAIEEYRRHAPEDGSGPANAASRLVTMLQTDEIFRWPAWSLAGRRAAAASPTWMYAFDYVSTAFGGVLGSCHALDIPFAFDNLHRPGVEMFTGDTEGRQAIADQFASVLVSFARSGNPGWPGYGTDRRSTQCIGPIPELADDPDRALRLLWNDR